VQFVQLWAHEDELLSHEWSGFCAREGGSSLQLRPHSTFSMRLSPTSPSSIGPGLSWSSENNSVNSQPPVPY
jgi:hypothetical protein